MNNYRSQHIGLFAEDNLLHGSSYFPSLVGFLKHTPDIVHKTTEVYGVVCMCEFSLLVGWTLFKSLETLFNAGEGVPGLSLIRIYQKPCCVCET